MATEAQLRRIFPNAKPDILAGVIASLDLMDDYGVNTRAREEPFWAQLGHESGGLTIREENLRYSAKRMTEVWPNRFPNIAAAKPYANNPKALAEKTYGGRMGNGPAGSGDGWKYRGRGGIQLTGKDAYEAVGEIAGLDLVNNPDLASKPENYLRIALAFWKWKGLNAVCDRGDFTAITRKINGGIIGLADRKDWLAKVQKTLRSTPAPVSATPGAVGPGASGARVRAAQQRLDELGYKLLVDGSFGNRTRDAILAFQADNGLERSGVLDAETWEALDEASPRPVAPERAEATVKDLREEGSRIVGGADVIKAAAAGSAVLGGGTAVSQVAPKPEPSSWLDTVVSLIEPLKVVRDFASDHWGLLLLCLGVGAWFIGNRIQEARVEDKRTGKTV